MTGAILAGGRGERLGGREKWRLSLAGEPVLERLLRIAGRVCSRAVVIARDDEQAVALRRQFACDVWTDRIPGCGPLAGLQTALHYSREDVLLLACDLPGITTELLEELRAAHRPGVPATVFRSPAADPTQPGHLEPLCAIYSYSLLSAVTAALVAGRRAMHVLLELPGVVELPLSPASAAALLNVNTPGDLLASGAEFPA